MPARQKLGRAMPAAPARAPVCSRCDGRAVGRTMSGHATRVTTSIGGRRVDHDDSGASVQADQLFLRDLDDLDRRTTVADEYKALGAAALLRRLLLDEAPLVHQVNRYRRVRIRFRINGESPLERAVLEDNPLLWAIGDAIDPDAFPAPGISAPMDAKLNQFLARTVMVARGERLAEGDLIRQVAP